MSLAPGDQRPGPVAGRGELPDQVGVGRLVQRVELAAQPGPARRAGRVAVALGGRGPGGQRLGQLGPLPPPGRLGPVLGVPGQQLAAAQRGRGIGVAVGGARWPSARSTVMASGRSPTAVLEVISASSPTALRRAQIAVRRFARAAAPGRAGPQGGRHGLAVLGARAQGEDGEQPADGREK